MGIGGVGVKKGEDKEGLRMGVVGRVMVGDMCD